MKGTKSSKSKVFSSISYYIITNHCIVPKFCSTFFKSLFEYTFKLVKESMLYKTKVGDNLHASLIIPYLGASLYFEVLENDWLLINHHQYNAFDMSRPVLKI